MIGRSAAALLSPLELAIHRQHLSSQHTYTGDGGEMVGMSTQSVRLLERHHPRVVMAGTADATKKGLAYVILIVLGWRLLRVHEAV